MVLSLQRLSQYYTAEIKRGRQGVGNYDLHKGAKPSQVDGPAPPPSSPTAIVDRIRHGSTPPTTAIIESHVESEDERAAPSCVNDGPSPGGVSTQAAILTDSPPHQSNRSQRPISLATTYERAAHIIETCSISLDPRLHIFTVKGSQEPRVVQLHPKETCSCPSQGSCYHLAAAKLAIGMSESTTRKPLNLTLLRKNKRKRADKTAGRKRPRVNDVDVIPPRDADPDIELDLIATISAPALASTLAVNVPRAHDPQVICPVAADNDVEPIIDENICHACNSDIPPSRKQRVQSAKSIKWVGCEKCPRWYHAICVGVKSSKKESSYICDLCK